MNTLEITPVSGPIRGRIRPPGSKSITNRALIVTALAEGTSTLTGVLDSDDTRVMAESLRRLGWELTRDVGAAEIRVTGCGGNVPGKAAALYLQNSGTSIRFLTALCALGEGRFQLDGNVRMRERPIGPLVDALRAWGAEIHCDSRNDCPPVILNAHGLPGARIEVAGDLSSQYLSALLMAAPCASGPVEIRVTGELVSRPYIDMTIAVMRSFGARIEEPEANSFHISNVGYKSAEYVIEPDASAASYFFAAAAVTGGKVTVEGLSRDSVQGDVHFVDVLEKMGCEVTWSDDAVTVTGGPLRGVEVDMNAISDTAQTLAAIAPFAEGPTRITGVAHMRHKETDRVAALVTELRRLGIAADEHPDGLTIHPGAMQPATIQTYDDHRMAMSFAVTGLRQAGIRIADPGSTGKTYPRFFEDLERLCRGRSES